MTAHVTAKLIEKTKQQAAQIDRQAETITARNIKILQLERKIAALERKEQSQ